MTDLSMMQPSTETNLTGRRRELSEFIEGSRAVAVITVLIVINAIALGLETDAGIMASYGGWLQVLDRIILIVFTVELAIKFYACRWQLLPLWLEHVRFSDRGDSLGSRLRPPGGVACLACAANYAPLVRRATDATCHRSNRAFHSRHAFGNWCTVPRFLCIGCVVHQSVRPAF